MAKATETEDGGLMYTCPGCGQNHCVYVKGDTHPGDGSPRPVWGWNGDLERPTITPSVLVRFGRGQVCHSYVKDGFAEILSDSTKNGGQTLELPEWA